MSITSLSLAEFFSEWMKIKESSNIIEPACDKDHAESLIDESDQASDFLASVGFENIIPEIKEGNENEPLFEDLEQIFTKNQVATIRKRVDTLKKKNLNRSARKDVRTLFNNEDMTPATSSSINYKTIPLTRGKLIISSSAPFNVMKKHLGGTAPFGTEELYDDFDSPSKDNNDDNNISNNINIESNKKPDNDDHLHRHREPRDEETKNSAITFMARRRSPFRNSGNSCYDSELFGPHIFTPYLTAFITSSGNTTTTTITTSTSKISNNINNADMIRQSREMCLDRTRIDDLGKKDLKMLEALAQIELMGVFDKFKVDFTKQKSKKKIKDKDGVFGVRLQVLLDRDCKADSSIRVPKFFKQLLNHMEANCLDEEGILRVSGSFTRIKEIRNEIDGTWYDNKFTFDKLRPNDASGLMKVFLRDLPSPLLTLEWIDSFIQIAKIPNINMQIYCLSLLMLLIPDVNRNTLKTLLEFLMKVAEHSSKNLMTEDSVAMIMAPNLFLISPTSYIPNSSSSHSIGNNQSSASSSCATADMDRDLLVATTTTAVILLMMKHQDEMFVVPAGLINQIRQKNQENKKKIIKKFWGKKEKSESSILNAKITISVLLEPYPEKISFKIKPHTTVSHVISSIVLQSRCASDYKSVSDVIDHFSLYEIGGNIEERRLEPNVYISSIIQVNPSASFTIRKKQLSLISTATSV